MASIMISSFSIISVKDNGLLVLGSWVKNETGSVIMCWGSGYIPLFSLAEEWGRGRKVLLLLFVWPLGHPRSDHHVLYILERGDVVESDHAVVGVYM